MPVRCYEDFTVGEVVEAGPVLVTADAIKAFAAQFDPQPMHLDGGDAQNTIVGGLFASGMHTVCLNMRLLVDAFLRDTNSMGSPGVDEIPLPRPGARRRQPHHASRSHRPAPVSRAAPTSAFSSAAARCAIRPARR